MNERHIIKTILLFIILFTGCQSTQGKEKHVNRLAKELSPYLLQHKDNPVDWYPWGEEAFNAARNEDKPIFLSIGYSTCHWCHVMEHESFEDSTVASLMNKYFINIKVDREERPDVDNIYMSVCQMMTGRGGWPLTIMMTPEKEPFFAGTYFPKEGRYGRPGMKELIPQVGLMWKNERQKLLANKDQILQGLKNSSTPKGTQSLNEETLKSAFSQYLQRFDGEYGGFQGRNKFPTAHNLSFLLRFHHRSKDPTALHIVEKTLQEMRKGGIWDHVGFGFHRYSTDNEWLVPHFEKMLYDQAINAIAYLEAYQITGNEEYAQTAKEIFTYVLRDMTSPEGGFYSAEDADSEGEEGKFYLWTVNELKSILGEADAQLMIDTYNVKEGGNFQEEASGHKTGGSIFHLKTSYSKIAEKHGLELEKFLYRIESARKKLFDDREKRIHPLKDTKILTDWNGLMIAALSKGGQVLEDDTYLNAAKRAADFVLSDLRTADGKLIKRYRNGTASLPAHIEDYAFMAWGLVELYETDFDVKYLKAALELTKIMNTYFWDEINGGYYFTASDGEELIVRTKEIYDGAIPSGNSVAAMVLNRLGRMTGNTDFEMKSVVIGRVFSDQVNRSPSGFSQLLSAVNFGLGPSYEIVVVGDKHSKDAKAMFSYLHQKFIPNKVLLFKPADVPNPEIETLASFTSTQESINNLATAYVCQNYACKAPTTDVNKMMDAIK
tara:strand:+ start:12507 stop:14666 length:2160 start_codon:yes stop_codon:yes gene_type:complete